MKFILISFFSFLFCGCGVKSLPTPPNGDKITPLENIYMTYPQNQKIEEEEKEQVEQTNSNKKNK